jgi:thiol-disulfide isomerase/thioredoxin
MTRSLARLLSVTMLVALASAGASLAHSSANASLRPNADNVRAAAPDLTLHDATGAAITLSDYRGKVVLLDFWATWCAGCKREIPWFIEFDQQYRDRGLVAIGVAMDDEGWQIVKPYLVEHPIPYRIVIGNADVARRFQVTSMPVTLLIDRDGRIADQHVGVVDKDAWEHKIRDLLQERTSAPARHVR